MKKILIFSVFTAFFSLAVFMGCSKQQDSNAVPVAAVSDLRIKFLANKTHDEVIQSFRNLSSTEKANLWIEKTNQLIASKLPQAHKNLLVKLKHLIQSNENPKKLEEFRATLIQLAKITPYADFLLMI